MSKYYSSSIAFGANQTKTEKVVVSPTKIGDVTTDAVSGALTVDEVPTLDSLNPVSSDGVARAVIQAGAELPTRGSSDTGKVLTVKNSDGDLEWDEPATVTVDQTYDSTSTNAQSGVAVAEAIAAIPAPSVDEVPAVTSSDDGKVLKATYNGGTGSYAWENETGTTYTAGDGVDITNNEISVKAGTGLEIGSATVQTVHNLTCSESVYDSYQGAYLCNDICPLTPDLISRIKATGGLTITLEKNYSTGGTPWWFLALYSPSSNNHFSVQNRYVLSRSNANHIGPVVTFDNSDYDSSRSNVSLSTIEANYANYRLGIMYDIGGGDYWTCFAQLSGSEPEVVATYADPTTVQNCVNVSNPLPASAQADAGKFLAVDTNGNATWADNPLPASSQADTGKVLMVGATGEATWAANTLPAYSDLDAGKVLQVQNDGTLAWVTLS